MTLLLPALWWCEGLGFQLISSLSLSKKNPLILASLKQRSRFQLPWRLKQVNGWNAEEPTLSLSHKKQTNTRVRGLFRLSRSSVHSSVLVASTPILRLTPLTLQEQKHQKRLFGCTRIIPVKPIHLNSWKGCLVPHFSWNLAVNCLSHTLPPIRGTYVEFRQLL